MDGPIYQMVAKYVQYLGKRNISSSAKSRTFQKIFREYYVRQVILSILRPLRRVLGNGLGFLFRKVMLCCFSLLSCKKTRKKLNRYILEHTAT